jgi:hypothetical protein
LRPGQGAENVVETARRHRRQACDRPGPDHVCFVDGSEERINRIVYATGYQISLPFLSSSVLDADGRELPLYRRIVATEVGGLYFAGFVGAPGGFSRSWRTSGNGLRPYSSGVSAFQRGRG